MEKPTTLQEARAVLKEEVDRYNNHQVHSTTKEIPSIRFEKAPRTDNSLFRPFCLPKPYTSPKDVFCLRETKMVNGYRRISLFDHTIEVPKVPLYEHVEIHLFPDTERHTMDVRIWRHDKWYTRSPTHCESSEFTFQVFLTGRQRVRYHGPSVRADAVSTRHGEPVDGLGLGHAGGLPPARPGL